MDEAPAGFREYERIDPPPYLAVTTPTGPYVDLPQFLASLIAQVPMMELAEAMHAMEDEVQDTAEG